MNRRPRVMGIAAISLLLILGCQPPELSYVLEHRDDFAQTEDLQTAGLTPGTVRDGLEGLSGCFGAYSIWSDGLLSLPDAEVYTFDVATGEMRYTVWQAGVVAGYSATFELAGNDRIRVTRQIGGETWTADALVTLDGDEMRIACIAADGNQLDGEAGEPDDPRVTLVFRRFECP